MYDESVPKFTPLPLQMFVEPQGIIKGVITHCAAQLDAAMTIIAINVCKDFFMGLLL